MCVADLNSVEKVPAQLLPTTEQADFYHLLHQMCLVGIIINICLHFLQCTACPNNTYFGGSPDACQPCPAMSSSPGGVVRVCPCMDGTGRVDESDPSLPCVGESVLAHLT